MTPEQFVQLRNLFGNRQVLHPGIGAAQSARYPTFNAATGQGMFPAESLGYKVPASYEATLANQGAQLPWAVPPSPRFTAAGQYGNNGVATAEQLFAARPANPVAGTMIHGGDLAAQIGGDVAVPGGVQPGLFASRLPVLPQPPAAGLNWSPTPFANNGPGAIPSGVANVHPTAVPFANNGPGAVPGAAAAPADAGYTLGSTARAYENFAATDPIQQYLSRTSVPRVSYGQPAAAPAGGVDLVDQVNAGHRMAVPDAAKSFDPEAFLNDLGGATSINSSAPSTVAGGAAATAPTGALDFTGGAGGSFTGATGLAADELPGLATGRYGSFLQGNAMEKELNGLIKGGLSKEDALKAVGDSFGAAPEEVAAQMEGTLTGRAGNLLAGAAAPEGLALGARALAGAIPGVAGGFLENAVGTKERYANKQQNALDRLLSGATEGSTIGGMVGGLPGAAVGGLGVGIGNLIAAPFASWANNGLFNENTTANDFDVSNILKKIPLVGGALDPTDENTVKANQQAAADAATKATAVKTLVDQGFGTDEADITKRQQTMKTLSDPSLGIDPDIAFKVAYQGTPLYDKIEQAKGFGGANSNSVDFSKQLQPYLDNINASNAEFQDRVSANLPKMSQRERDAVLRYLPIYQNQMTNAANAQAAQAVMYPAYADAVTKAAAAKAKQSSSAAQTQAQQIAAMSAQIPTGS